MFLKRSCRPFWKIMELCDWDNEGDDDKVLKPVIEHLASKGDKTIFEFDDMMTELLYSLDTKKLADECKKAEPYMCDDSFLYSRCVALINGPDYYERVKNGIEVSLWKMEFESLLYVPQRAWALKHNAAEDDYPHIPPLSYETGSNTDGWK